MDLSVLSRAVPSLSADPRPSSAQLLWMIPSAIDRHSRGSAKTLRAIRGYHVVLGPQRCWTAPVRRGYLAVTMSVLASRLDRASASYRANRSANLRLLEELSEQLVQSTAGCDQGYVDRYRCSTLALSACHSRR
jgi:hypothetical protein